MRGLAVLTVALVFAAAPLASTPASAQATATLEGAICILPPYDIPERDREDAPCAYGQPLPEALVTLRRPGTLPVGPSPVGPTEATATSDANGQYRFSGLAAGDYSAVVTRTGFEDAVATVTVGSGTVRDFGLEGKSVEATGRVLDADGASIAKAEVTLCCDDTGQHAATTGSDGRYRATVRAGYWSLDVRAPGFQPAYQSALVDGGDVDLRLERVPPQDARLSGVVRDQDGAPVADARVALSNYGYPCCATGVSSDMAYSRPAYSGENYTFTDAQGRYSMGAYSGEGMLSVSKEGYAYRSRSVSVATGSGNTADVELLKYPAKTARVMGSIVDARTGDPVPTVYLSLSSPEYGLSECGQPTGGSSGGQAKPMPLAEPSIARGEPAPSAPGCAITIADDGSFEGLVTPGFGILTVHVDWYALCMQGGGDPSRGDCGGQYYAWSASRVLAADGTTTFDVRLRSRPAPDAEVSGYIIDAETGEAIPGASVSFSNQDNYAYGTAVTDDDGSYRLRLRSGYHTVYVTAPGHLHWEGVLDVPEGDSPFDVTVQPGEEAYGGGCCWAYAHSAPAPMAAEDSAASGKSAGGVGSSTAAGDEATAESETYFDLGGGLGPYDPEARASELQEPSNGSPGIGLLAVLAAVGAVLALRRRQA